MNDGWEPVFKENRSSFGTPFKYEAFVVVVEKFPGKTSSKDEVDTLSSLCDGLGTVAESAGPDMTAYASQALECIFDNFLAARKMKRGFFCVSSGIQGGARHFLHR